MAKAKIVTIDQSIQLYLQYLQNVIEKRLQNNFAAQITELDVNDITLPPSKSIASPFSDFVKEHNLSFAEIITLLIAMAPHINPVFFDQLIQQHIPNTGDFPQLGGVRGKNHRGFLPTGETVLFILAGTNIERKLSFQTLFAQDHIFSKLTILWLEDVPAG